jgi:hypothetical protein
MAVEGALRLINSDAGESDDVRVAASPVVKDTLVAAAAGAGPGPWLSASSIRFSAAWRTAS